jgi:hypothetical protein
VPPRELNLGGWHNMLLPSPMNLTQFTNYYIAIEVVDYMNYVDTEYAIGGVDGFEFRSTCLGFIYNFHLVKTSVFIF